MLHELSGRTHQVATGVCIVKAGDTAAPHAAESLSFVDVTDVTFYELTDGQIEHYVTSGEPMDKAGAYGIQGIGANFVPGNYDASLVDEIVTVTDEDAYHKHKRHIPKPLIIIAVLAVVCGGAYWFVTTDPMGVMPGFYDQFGQAAQTTFPTRQKGEATEDDTKQGDSAEVVQEETVLTDDQLYTRLDGLYQTIVSYADEDQIGEVIDSFNNGYLRTPLSTRQELSQSAYALRDQIKKTQDELNNLKVQDDTVYADDIAHLKQLAEWMYERVDVICQSWDISLAIPDGESMSSHQSEILAPIAQGGNSALNQYDANVGSWKPQQRS